MKFRNGALPERSRIGAGFPASIGHRGVVRQEWVVRLTHPVTRQLSGFGIDVVRRLYVVPTVPMSD